MQHLSSEVMLLFVSHKMNVRKQPCMKNQGSDESTCIKKWQVLTVCGIPIIIQCVSLHNPAKYTLNTACPPESLSHCQCVTVTTQCESSKIHTEHSLSTRVTISLSVCHCHYTMWIQQNTHWTQPVHQSSSHCHCVSLWHSFWYYNYHYYVSKIQKMCFTIS